MFGIMPIETRRHRREEQFTFLLLPCTPDNLSPVLLGVSQCRVCSSGCCQLPYNANQWKDVIMLGECVLGRSEIQWLFHFLVER